MDAISAVSGGTLPAIYYTLHQPQSEKDWDVFRNKMKTDFFSKWAWKAFSPLNLLWAELRGRDRSDIMSDIFSSELFAGKTFMQLPRDGPRLFINATTENGHRFLFTTEMFNQIRSRLDTYPLAYAAMASGAFPGLFNNVTLRIYPRHYRDVLRQGTDPDGLKSRIMENPKTPIDKYFKQRILKTSSYGRLSRINKFWSVYEIYLALGEIAEGKEDALQRGKVKLLIEHESFASIHLPENVKALIEEKNLSYDQRKYINLVTIETAYPNFFAGENKEEYLHLFDGGTADNLGVSTLIDAAKNFALSARQQPLKGCLIIAVDANQSLPILGREPGRYQSDPREFIDHIIDTNIFPATDTMLLENRSAALRRLGLTHSFEDLDEDLKPIIPPQLYPLGRFKLFDESLGDPFPSPYINLENSLDFLARLYNRRNENGIQSLDDKNIECLVWHINFGRLLTVAMQPDRGSYEEMNFALQFYFPLALGMSNIQTHYKLVESPGCDKSYLQQMLYDAAHILVQDDWSSVQGIFNWFSKSMEKLPSANHSLDPEPLLKEAPKSWVYTPSERVCPRFTTD